MIIARSGGGLTYLSTEHFAKGAFVTCLLVEDFLTTLITHAVDSPLLVTRTGSLSPFSRYPDPPYDTMTLALASTPRCEATMTSETPGLMPPGVKICIAPVQRR